MQLTILTTDFESFYGDDYTLRTMTPVEYICDPRFELIGAALRLDTITLPMAPPTSPRAFMAKARWVEGPRLGKVFKHIDWSTTAFMSHNVAFDGAILAWRFGIVPQLYIDTLGMCRAMLPEAKGASLDKALACIGAPPKGTAIKAARGMRLADMHANPAFYDTYKRYAERDDDGAFWLFEHLAHGFAGTGGVGRIHKNEEFVQMDMVARMAILPQFTIDRDITSKYLDSVVQTKADLLHMLTTTGVLDPNDPKRTLMSDEKFAAVLEQYGIDPPLKRSIKTGKISYAFAKTDKEFTDLEDDPDPIVQALVAARLGHKSTLEETRTGRFLKIADTQWPGPSAVTVEPKLIYPPRMPWPLRYSGAHTHRLSGDWSLNLQNLKRDSELRRALQAPPGYMIVSADASQIEARIVSWLAGCTALVNAFANKEDVYSTFAGSVFDYAVNKRDNPGERFVGKTGILGLGFGMGPPKFVLTCRNQGRANKLAPELYTITPEFSVKVVNTYRTDYKEIPALWRLNEQVIQAIANRMSMTVGPMIVDGPTQSIILPNGMRLYYHDMQRVVEPDLFNPGQMRTVWRFQYGRETKYTFGGKMTENEVQALAKIITMSAATRIRRIVKDYDWIHNVTVAGTLAGQAHDQLLYVVPESVATDFRDLLVTEMRRKVDWFFDLPLDAEGAIGPNLLEAK